MNNYLDFIMYLAFEVGLTFDKKGTFSIDTLNDYRKKLCELSECYYEDYEFSSEEFHNKLIEFHKFHKELSDEEFRDFVISFVEDNSFYFELYGENVRVADDITLDDIANAKMECDSYSTTDDYLICGVLIGLSDKEKLLETLDVGFKIRSFMKNLVSDCKKLEKAYAQYQFSDLIDGFDKLVSSINFRINLIGNFDMDRMRCFHRIITGNDDSDAIGEDFFLLSDDLVKTSRYYKLLQSSANYLLCNKYQRAIFDSGTLAYDRINALLSAIWDYRDPTPDIELEPVDEEAFLENVNDLAQQAEEFDDEFGDDLLDRLDDPFFIGDEDEDEEEEELNLVDIYLKQKQIDRIFYFKYLEKIDKYQSKYGQSDSLESAKSRLLYLLDTDGERLYVDSNLEDAISASIYDGNDMKNDFSEFYIVSRLFMEDINNGLSYDRFYLRKLLFIEAYLDITHDESIIKMVDKYSDTENGDKVNRAVTLGDYSGFIEKEKGVVYTKREE